eukprot:TRINITY_DN63087_c0_g1_i1.p1 TRINITY_DN63087_c0_g1~~TRINITY_DN63087_c0_g1_i1.p1  ORF type:complete len:477 (-),score=57.00 TRINITY_DN63087_c0_g1_i1:104-1534(-)
MVSLKWLAALLAVIGAVHSACGHVIDLQEYGALPENQSAAEMNTAMLNRALAGLQAGDTLYVPNKTYWLAGGVRAVGLFSVVIKVDGTLRFLPGRSHWPLQHTCGVNILQPTQRRKTCVQEAFFVANSSRITFTSNSAGTLDGSGSSWWGYINYARFGEDRPRLLSISNATDILVERWHFVNSAYWTFTALDVARMEIRYCSIDNRVNNDDFHGPKNLGAFNTDGFDFAGRDIYIHHCSVWNQDDCFTVQPLDASGDFQNANCTENVLVEDVSASGLGLTVGAVRPTKHHNCVRNVTFRRALMHHTFKGIYIKSQNTEDAAASGEISNILYEDVIMEAPTQVPIWIGPAQEEDSYKACSLAWPEVPFASCPPPPTSMQFANITLRNITIRDPKQSPGVIYGNPDHPMENVVFDNVVVTNPGKSPWGSKFYKCEGVRGTSSNGTMPVPPCFEGSIEGLSEVLVGLSEVSVGLSEVLI